jgi:anti-anti-sigma factor
MPIKTVERDEGLVIHMSGSFDRQASEDLEDVINDNEEGHDNVVINMFDVNYISSVSIGTLVKLHRELNEKNQNLMISNVSDECQEIFDMISANEILPIYENEDEAFSSGTKK